MQTSKLKAILAVSIAFFIIACNDSSKKDKSQKDKTSDTASAASNVPLPSAEKNPLKKCFTNEGLKYKTIISITRGYDEVAGEVTSEDLGSGKKETVQFEGTVSGNQLTIKFKGNGPVMGDASEWTSKPWTLDDKPKEHLHIVFNAKNYETNKWEETEYEFNLADCK